MAQIIRRFTVTVPAGTLKAAPVTINLNFDPLEVERLEINVPPGPRGELGFKIAQAGFQVFPYGNDDFFVTDNEQVHWPIEDANTSGAWQAIAYNTGTYAHSFEVRFLCNLPASREPAANVRPIPAGALR